MIRLILALPTSCPRCAENQAAKLLDQDGLEPLATSDLQCVCPASEVVSLLEGPEPKRAKPDILKSIIDQLWLIFSVFRCPKNKMAAHGCWNDDTESVFSTHRCRHQLYHLLISISQGGREGIQQLPASWRPTSSAGRIQLTLKTKQTKASSKQSWKGN